MLQTCLPGNIKASVGQNKDWTWSASMMNTELLCSTHSLKKETFERNFWSCCYKLQECCFLTLGEWKHNVPEPDNLSFCPSVPPALGLSSLMSSLDSPSSFSLSSWTNPCKTETIHRHAERSSQRDSNSTLWSNEMSSGVMLISQDDKLTIQQTIIQCNRASYLTPL